MLENSYKNQYERMLRYLERIKYESGSSQEYDDDLWAFFQSCWHLKDWIKNDSAVDQNIRNNIEKEIMGYQGIMICADIANGTKHLKLTNKREGADVVSRGVTVNLNDLSKCTCKHNIRLDNGVEVTAQDIAPQVVSEWQDFMKKNQLL